MKEEIIELGEIEVKRFYLPFKEEMKCPDCGTLCEVDFNNEYISYPNGKENIHFCCPKCDTEFESKTTIEIVAIVRREE